MGGTKQVQKTKTAQVTTRTAITQAQSLAIVQTLLHGGLSNLAYYRELFSEKVFDIQPYQAGRIPSYADFAEGHAATGAKNGQNTRTQAVNMAVLRRNRSKRVDQVLEHLQNVVFKGLKENRLQALQIRISPDPKDLAKALETYTFTVKYEVDEKGDKSPTGIDFGGLSNKQVTVEDTTSTFQALTLAIRDLCNTLPALPDERFLRMNAIYNDEIDEVPPGWKRSKSDGLAFPSIDGWRKNSKTFTPPYSGFMSASLKVSYVEPDQETTKHLGQQSQVPEHSEYLIKGSLQDEIDTDMLGAVVATPSTVVEPDTAQRSRTLRPAQDIPTPKPTADSLRKELPDAEFGPGTMKRMASQALELETAVTGFGDGLDTQSNNVPNMKSKLQAFMQPERLTQGDTQTQAPLGPPRVPSRSAQADRATPSTKMGLASVAAQKKADKGQLRKTVTNTAHKGNTAGIHRDDVVVCQCESEESEEDTIKCLRCGNLQHLHCYGFSGEQDARVPEEHICYQCSLGHEGEEVLRHMRELVLKRRAMIFTLRDGLKRKTDLARTLDIRSDVASSIHQYLVDEGFVTATAKSHQPGFAKTGKPYFVPVTSGEHFDKMARDLFDPFSHVEPKHSSNSNVPEAVKRQLLQLQRTDMPPPSGPVSRKANTATRAPAPEPGSRSSTTLGQTPSHTRANSLKRGRDRDDMMSTPAKRVGSLRLHSIETSFAINVNGLSSSPAPAQ